MKEACADTIGPRELFEQNCPEYYNFLLHFLIRIIGNRTEAEDVTQETFLHFHAFMERKQWKEDVRNVRAYLIKSAVHLRLDAWRSTDLWRGQREEGSMGYDDEQSENVRKVLDREAMQHNNPTAEIEDGIYFKELFKSLPLKTMLSDLTPYQREILRLEAEGEMTPKEIAPIVGKPVSEVRYDLVKIHSILRYRTHKVFKKSGGKPF